MRLIDADSITSKINNDLIICKKESLEDVKQVLDFMAQAIENEPTVELKTLEKEKHIEMLGREYVAQDIENGKGFIVGHFIREPVIRCNDCIYWQDNNGGYINEWCKWRKDETPDPEDYCSCGDRKQDKEGEEQ